MFVVMDSMLRNLFLQFMAALKKLQAEKDSGEWESLSEEAQQQVSLFPSIP